MIFSRDLLLVIAFALLIAFGIGGFNYWQKYRERKLDEVAAVVYLYEKGTISKEEMLRKVKDTPFAPYALLITDGSPKEIAKHLKDEDMRKLFLEKNAFELYSAGSQETALGIVDAINRKDFNYPSALLLKAIIHESLGETETARKLYEELYSSYGDLYFGRIAYARLLLLEQPR